MELVIVGAACALLGAGVASIALRSELLALSRALALRRTDSNVRLKCDVRAPGMIALVRAMNGRLDAMQADRIALGEEQAAFREGLACLSHDIRTPLAGAQGYLQLADRAADAETRQRYERAAAERLGVVSSLLDGLFAYAQTQDEAFALVCEPLCAAAILEEVLLGAFPQFAERGWTPEVHLDEKVLVLADERALERVFANLVANSLQHGAGPLSVVQKGGALLFSNALAEGSRPDAEALFERFYRGRSERTVPGAGLGLTTVRALVERMGGTVSARIEGDGLCIELTLLTA